MADIWGTIKSIVGKVAPILGNAILPGVGGAAGTLLAGVLGCDPDKPEEVLAKVQNMTPEEAVKVIELQNRHEERFVELAVEQDRLYLADRQSARQREVDMAKTTGKADKNMYVLAWVVIGGFFGTILGVIALKLFAPAISLNDEPLLSLLLGALSTDAGMVVGYFFGSSKGSAEKTALLTEQKKP